ncbi:MAG: 2-amino-4-hydroxy-6-hydroxymethyldihydropteridine diphosphokinase [Candidatus Firestonebacteria bacterium GWA2_43_8]|nr:MAG: 2-amino-4-hydroxy-6-hydroxymethyldihydropteridine diphosphokinase [Candidatus Firestonebacteria bacterium GWA2_43_8]
MPVLKAYLSIGSNVGNRSLNLKKAVLLLSKYGNIRVLRVSPLYETEPVGEVKQRCFLNGVVEIKTELSPLRLLAVCKEIEKKLKRKKTVKWGPRIIDLDIILYGNRIVKQKGLTVPHKEMIKREFVLRPLVDLNKKGVHPVVKKSFSKLLKEVKGGEKVEKYGKGI